MKRKFIRFNNLFLILVMLASNSIAFAASDSAPSYQQDSIDYVNIHEIVEYNNNYYCYENGNFVINGWRKISLSSFAKFAPVSDFKYENIWAFFAGGGKAIKAASNSFKKVNIGGYTYAFNEYGQLITGYFNDQAEMWNEKDSEDPFNLLNDNNNLYHSDEYTGILTSGWHKLKDPTSRYPNKDIIWLYFQPNNHKIARSTGNSYKSLTIDGKNYAFDDNGVMLTGFEATRYNELHGGPVKRVFFDQDGAEVKNGFYNIDMSDDENIERFDEYSDYDEDITIYLSKNGQIYKNTIKKINNGYYGFDQNGVLLKGLTVWTGDNYVDTIDTESTDAKSFMISGRYKTKNGDSRSLNSSDTLYYFNNSGKRVTTSTKIEFANDTYTFLSNSSWAIEGLHSSKYYIHGLLIKPEEDTDYGVYIENPTKSDYTMKEIANTANIVIRSNGSVVSSKSVQKDENDNYWLVNNKSLVNIYSVQVKIQGSKYYFRSENKNGSDVWIEFGEKDSYGRTCVEDVVANGTRLSNGAISYYQERLQQGGAINFNIK